MLFWDPELISYRYLSCCCSFCQKSLRLRHFKSDRDENWQDCSSSKCASTDMTSYFQDDCHDIIWHECSSSHSTRMTESDFGYESIVVVVFSVVISADKTHKNNIQIVTGVEVTIGNCLPDVWEILPDAEVTKSDVNCASNDVTRVHFVKSVRSVYSSDWLEIMKYYLAIKVSSNAVRNISKDRNLAIS